MLRRLARLFSYHSFIILAALVGVLLGVGLTRDGLSALDGVGLALYLGGSVALNRLLRPPSARAISFDALAAFDATLRGPLPTLVEFYSDYCVACMAAEPFMEKFSREVGTRLQILRVNVYDPDIGRQLADRYRVTFTPTFILFDTHGQPQDEFLYALNRPRVLYWLDRHFSL